MLSLMLDPKFKSLRLIYFFGGCEEGVVIVKIYDRKFLYLMFLKCYYHLHPMTKIKGGFAM
jgi:hypothetical protein